MWKSRTPYNVSKNKQLQEVYCVIKDAKSLSEKALNKHDPLK